MELKGKRIGIWGYGITGRSTTDFMLARGAHVGVMDKNPLTEEEDYFAKHGITYFPQNQSETFFASHDLIIPSAGIDLRPYYEQYKDKWLFELDIFAKFFTKPYIAITGSVGKTSITSLVSQLLALYGKKVATGGNIGIASLDLIEQQDSVEMALLEVSSFQLEHVTSFAPELAVITNIIENHLDRHGTMEEYTRAKYNIGRHTQKFLKPPFNHSEKAMLLLKDLPPITFDENWLIIIAILESLGLPLADLPTHAQNLIMPEHRIEYVTTICGVRYYNDSKSTAPAATQAAVEKFSNQPIHLLLGGLSKGIDREPLISGLRGKVAQVYCFGKEAEVLNTFCKKHQVPSNAYATLEHAVAAAHALAAPNSIVLLSPAGSSYDLFENFEHRGRAFKEIVKTLEPAFRSSKSEVR